MWIVTTSEKNNNNNRYIHCIKNGISQAIYGHVYGCGGAYRGKFQASE